MQAPAELSQADGATLRPGTLALASIIGVLVVAGCGLSHPAGTGAQRTGKLVVWQLRAPSSSVFIEGELTQLRLTGADGDVVLTGTFMPVQGKPLVSRSVSPGRYTLQGAQRVCDANCSMLAPPTPLCTTRISIAAGQSTREGLVLDGFHCRFEIATAQSRAPIKIVRPAKPVWCWRDRVQRVHTAGGSKVRLTRVRLLDARQLLGLPQKQADAIAVKHGCTRRLLARNGHNLVVTSDLRANRVDRTIADGKVTAVGVG